MFSAAPEVFYVKRTRINSSQDGVAFGGTIQYERLKRSGIFIHGHGSYHSATLNGLTISETAISSDFHEKEWEGRLGYTGSWFKNRLWIIPYAGLGTLVITNQFKDPTPVAYCLTNSCDYYTCGFKCIKYCSESLSLQGEINGQIVMNGSAYIDDEPLHEKLIIGDSYFANVFIGVNYASICKNYCASLFCFYKERHYGHKENYPIDFLETTYKLIGVQLFLHKSF